ncbi:MAG: transposase [Deltaproteobacteria bacterium]|nr:transposase [Deltaproteobacteria bacterium]
MGWAELRFSVIGPLLASPPSEGELGVAIEELAARRWRHPVTGQWTTFGASTIERWFYLAKGADDPIAALRRKVRKDAGRNKAIKAALLDEVRRQYQAYPGWSYKLHADNLRALVEGKPELGPTPSYSTVRRRMVESGWVRRKMPRNPTPGQRRAIERLERREVRSYEASHVHALWHYDFHEGSRKVVTTDAEWHVPQLFAVLDDRSRLCCHAQWYLLEETDSLVHGLRQAYHKRGLPRAEMHDNGGAMRAQEIESGAERLGIVAEPTLSYSPYQNAKAEVFWSSVEGRLIAMLKRVEPLKLDFLNRATQAWVEQEYNREVHEELGVPPLERMLEGPDVSRPAPDTETLRFYFTRRERRTQRRSDGTVSIRGVRFELPSRLRFCDRVWVRYQKWDLSMAYVVDEKTNDLLAHIYPLDKERNAAGIRRSLEPTVDPSGFRPPAEQVDPLPPLMRKYLAAYAATGLPPAYLPKEEADIGPRDEEDDHE